MSRCKLVPEAVAEKEKNHIGMTDQSKAIDSCMLFQHENEVFILHKGEGTAYVVRAVAS
jgi:hemin uptake protein HemP